MGTKGRPGDGLRAVSAQSRIAFDDAMLLRDDPLGGLKEIIPAVTAVTAEALDRMDAAAARAEAAAARVEAALAATAKRPPLDYGRVEKTISEAAMRTVAPLRKAIDRRTSAVVAGSVVLATLLGMGLGWIAHGL